MSNSNRPDLESLRAEADRILAEMGELVEKMNEDARPRKKLGLGPPMVPVSLEELQSISWPTNEGENPGYWISSQDIRVIRELLAKASRELRSPRLIPCPLCLRNSLN